VNPRTLKLTISYEGTRLVGWQRQAGGESVQGLLERALAPLAGSPVTVHGAGRTDAGVHALGQVASVHVTCAHSLEVLHRALNASLPLDVRVLDVREVDSRFHARFSARAKTYRYLVYNGSLVSPFAHRYVWQIVEPLDLDAMQDAAQMLVGTHEFSAFRSAGGAPTTSVRTIMRSGVSTHAGFGLVLPTEVRCGVAVDEYDGSRLLAYEVTGSGFLRYMVRAIAGTLVDIGRGRHPSAWMASLLDGGRRSDAGATAPAQGLFLVRVDYD
jgi:tRNA pseudouridine38-40 synthase